MIRLATIFGLLGLAAATALFLWQGIGPVFAAFAAAGWGIVLASIFHFLPMASNARAWQVLLPKRRRRPSVAFFFWAVWLRESVNGLLPVARIGGEVVTARLLMDHGLRPAVAVASLMVDVTVSLVSQFFFALIGLAMLALIGVGGSLAGEIVLALVAVLPLFALWVLAQRFGIFGVLARIMRGIFGDRFDRLVGGAAPIDRAIRRLYRRRAALIDCGLWQLLGWIAGAGEIWIALVFLGWPVNFAAALMIEALIQALSSGAFVVPAALGVQEGGFLVLGGLVGLPAEIALALALARRARDVIVFGPALLFWQLTIGRRLAAGA